MHDNVPANAIFECAVRPFDMNVTSMSLQVIRTTNQVIGFRAHNSAVRTAELLITISGINYEKVEHE